ncbi:beta-N-acetylhexosaminidase [Thermodesulfobacteriota bacterium]
MNTIPDISELNHNIGQLFMIGIPGTGLDKNTEDLIRDYNIGGIILFSRNISDPLQLAELCTNIKTAALKHHGNDIFIAVDQEGGNVARLKEPFSIFPGNEEIGKDADPGKKAREFGVITAKEMSMVGLNMNLAPVMDVKAGTPDKHLKGRIFSDDPDNVALLGGIVIDSLQESGIMSVAKHFPGLGMANFDPHQDQVTIRFKSREIEKDQLIPFISSIKKNVSGIMTSHAVYPSIDPEYPGTLSRDILTGLLRKELQYNGLILTDDLEMGAISKTIGVPEGAVASFKAGADILLICENQQKVVESIEYMRREILSDEIRMSRLLESLERINSARLEYLHPGREISMAETKEYFKLKV